MATLLILSKPLWQISAVGVLRRVKPFIEARTLYVKYDPKLNNCHVPFNSDFLNFSSKFYDNCQIIPGVSVRFITSNVFNRRDRIPPSKHRFFTEIVKVIHDEPSSNIFKYMAEHFTPISSDCVYQQVSYVDSSYEDSRIYRNTKESTHSTNELESSFSGVVIGGTFDRFHNGHGLLLNGACLRAEDKLVCGVTDGPMLHSKVLPELIEPVEVRIKHVRDFIAETRPQIEAELEPIFDPFGPSIVDENLQCIVVSDETRRGGDRVNELRAAKHLNVLHVAEVKLIDNGATDDPVDDVKLSSSNNRMNLLGTLLRPARGRVDHDAPYVIGLTGGIASGKSSVAKRLAGFGCDVIDCDILGHESYLPGTTGYQLILDTFGSGLLDRNGCIDRGALGNLVFHDKAKLVLLNDIVWPRIRDLLVDRLKKKSTSDVVVVEAALLLTAGWDDLANEVWVTMVPETEAIRRMSKRNPNLPEEQARCRIESQMPNKELMSRANVAISTLWHPDITQSFAERAWRLLNERIK